MPLTPADVHNVAFKKPMLGKRGYDEDEVDGFLDEVERELVRLNEENADLRAQIESLRAGAPPGAADNAELAAALERVQREKSMVEQEVSELEMQLGELHQQMQIMQQQQQAAAPAVPVQNEPANGGGEQEALHLLMMAQRTADEHMEEAERKAESMIGEARAEAEDLMGQAKDRAARLEADAEQRHKDAMSTLETKRSSLLKHIEELKTFERDYRTRLKMYLESQLRDLNGQTEGDADAMEAAKEKETTRSRKANYSSLPL